jgi:hypothetical protein
MTDLTNIPSNTFGHDSNMVDHDNSCDVRSASSAVRNRLHMRQQTSNIQQSNHITQIDIQSIVKQVNNNCVKDLNLILTNLNQLKSEITNKIFDSVKTKYYKKLMIKKNNKQFKEEKEEHKKYIIIETYIIQMLICINSYLKQNRISQSYKIMAFYQIESEVYNKYKQLISIIPYRDGNPLDGISEIVSINTDGQDNKNKILTKLINGGFGYTKDWLDLTVTNETLKQYIQQINITYCNEILRGFSINYNMDIKIGYEQTKFKLHVPEFSKYW